MGLKLITNDIQGNFTGRRIQKVLVSAVMGLAVCMGMPPSASALVSMKNMNFSMSYVDLGMSGGMDIKIARTYNSKSGKKGIFGWGWSTELETNLVVSADGSIVVHEFGGGADNRFYPVKMDPSEITKAANAIAAAAEKAGYLGTGKQAADYKKRLVSDATFRNDEWEKLRAQGKLAARQLPVDTKLISVYFNYQYITKVAGGFERTSDTGKIEKFDESGKLVRIADKNGNFLDLKYAKNGRLDYVVDNLNRKIYFEFNSKNLVAKLRDASSRVASYQYNDKDELISSTDVDNDHYVYKYDSAGRHNLTEIAYADKTAMDIAYYGRDKREDVKSIKNRDGSITKYETEGSSDSPRYVAITSISDKDGKPISKSKYEYSNKNKATGEEWTEKLISEETTYFDGKPELARTETTYSESCGLPISIKNGSEETTFAYDVKCRVTKKTTPLEITELRYDPTAGKVERVAISTRDGKSLGWSEFKYDNKGNLITAKNSEGKGVKLLYDPQGRIREMIDLAKHDIRFKYNELSKPIEITEEKVGTIRVSYTNTGDVKNVESTAGRKVASEVSAEFQELLSIIRPAGVTLSF